MAYSMYITRLSTYDYMIECMYVYVCMTILLLQIGNFQEDVISAAGCEAGFHIDVSAIYSSHTHTIPLEEIIYRIVCMYVCMYVHVCLF